MTPFFVQAEPGWCVEDNAFTASSIERNGSKFMIGNGAVGVRGTLEEFAREQLVACTVSGLYDQVPGRWREPVNAPNGFSLRIWYNGRLLSPVECVPLTHRQIVNLRTAVHRRETVYQLPDGLEICVEAERFLSLADVHTGVAWHRMSANHDCNLVVEVGVDGAVWDLNGPHLDGFVVGVEPDLLTLSAVTREQGVPVGVSVAVSGDFQRAVKHSEPVVAAAGIFRRFTLSARAHEVYSIERYIDIRTGVGAASIATAGARKAKTTGHAVLFAASAKEWERRWERSDVRVEGDETAQLALRYSIYQLLIATPAHTERASIPARGLSGQVYKGGIFWDTEMFMLPFFDHTQPELARSLLRYRYHTLDGARRKAVEQGGRGAFYAWESQDTGDDACTFFNVTDVFTGRPMRTYFRDKQVHISADVALATWRHFQLSGDAGFLLEGGAEVILECARFFLSFACFNPERQRYELRDVVGPDEYHERVDNNAFTSAMARETVGIALEVLAWLMADHPECHEKLVTQLAYAEDAARLRDLHARLFVPEPDPLSGVIEQFSGYHKLEDVSLAEVKRRVLRPNEYWGGGNGVAVHTQVIKQADTVLLLHLFSDRYSAAIRRANWEHYEPRTEHGSSLSACVYALVAAKLGKIDWAYRYFLKTATIDLTGDSKQYVGTLYIGGTHPAANGGAWMAAVLGFGGLECTPQGPRLYPQLPAMWQRLMFRFAWRGNWFSTEITPDRVTVTADASNSIAADVDLAGNIQMCVPGATVSGSWTRTSLS